MTADKGSEFVRVPVELVKFLLGEAELDGQWFLDSSSDRPRYWWRDNLRECLAAAPAPTQAASCELLRQVSAMKALATRAHQICYETMRKHPDISELGDDGVLHCAIHDILAIDTPDASDPQPVQGEAVACVVNGYLPRQRAVEVRLDVDVPDWIAKAPGVRAYLSTQPPAPAAGDATSAPLPWSEKERAVILALMHEHEFSYYNVMRQCLRLYQHDQHLRANGETCIWSGDAQRARDFAGTTPAVQIAAPDHIADAGKMVAALEWMRGISKRNIYARDHLPAIEEAISAALRSQGQADAVCGNCNGSGVFDNLCGDRYPCICQSGALAQQANKEQP